MKQMNRSFLLTYFSFFLFVAIPFAQNEKEPPNDKKPSCQELIPPQTREDITALRQCIRSIKKFKRQESQKNKAQKSTEQDTHLRGEAIPKKDGVQNRRELYPNFCLYDFKKKRCFTAKSAPLPE